jgi:ABC-type multidrug transport system permease subunit
MTIPFHLPPIVERELRVASRRPVTYWSRTGAAASGMLIVCFLMFTQLKFTPTALVGQMTFRLLAWIAAITVIGSVVQLASEAFAREKREDTLGLLFLTPLRPIDLVLGKLVSTSLAAIYRFVALIPLLAIPMLTGGVAVRDFALLVVALVNFVFLGATVGLFVSVRCWDEKRAATVASVTVVCLALLPAIGVVVSAVLNQPSAFSFFALSPIYPVWQATVRAVPNPGWFWPSIVWTHLVAWIFFYAACRTLPRCWQRRPENLAPAGDHLQPTEASTQSSVTNPARLPTTKSRRSVRRQFNAIQRTAMLNDNPIRWFAQRWRPHASGLWIIGAIGLASCVPALVTVLSSGRWDMLLAPGFALFVIFCLHAAFKTYATSQASFAFARDRGEDTLELLLATPVTPQQLIDGHARALRETLRPWVKRALWIEGGWLAFTLTKYAWEGGNYFWMHLLGAVAMLGFLIPDLHAAGWTALWQSVLNKNAREAEKSASWRVMFLPWVVALLVWIPFGAMMNSTTGLAAMIVAWMVTSALVDDYCIRQSRYQLETQLALWAQRRSAGEFEHYDGWRRIGRRLGRWWATRGEASVASPR